MILGLLDEAVAAGARQKNACEILGIDAATVQRWRRRGIGEDGRCGPKTPQANRLSKAEEREVLHIANSPRFRDLSPRQIVPQLADEGRYVASEATMYRVLGRESQMTHRSTSRAPQSRHRPLERRATAPRQVWSWDITWLKKLLLRGGHFKLYMVLDVFSRKIVGWTVHEEESSELAAALLEHACRLEEIERHHLLVLHSDNGAPMKGSTLLAKLEELGVATSFSRPRVSDDNPFSESLFGTMKGCPRFPADGFEDLEHARRWVAAFVAWYNNQHLHSGIRYVTPAARHRGEDRAILAKRKKVYEDARRRRPERWTQGTRDWSPIEEVRLNPESDGAMAN